MKKMRKLIPAIAMLLISAVMMSTASYAWFSMNKNVTANGMSVNAVSDSATLVIVPGNETIDANTTSITASGSLSDVSLYPITPAVALSSGNVETATSWKYAYSNSISNGMSGVTDESYTVLTDGTKFLSTDADATKVYVAKTTFKVGLQGANGGLDEVKNLKIDKLTMSNVNAGITVVVVCGTNIFSYNANVADGGTDIIAATVSKTVPAEIAVYIYIDGDDTDVYTNNRTTLTGNIEIGFECE